MSFLPRWGLVVCHAVVVGGLLALLGILLATHDTPDANIGAGLGGLALLVIGLPWSLPFLLDPDRFGDASNALRALVIAGPALLNLLLHAAITAVRRRRRG
jgi:hypothetical protein